MKPLADFKLVKRAYISPCGLYRYNLERIWDPTLVQMTWCMLNPSTADAEVDDHTIRKCVGFARRWGYGGIHVVNLFALRSTDPRELSRADDPVGPENLEMLRGPLREQVVVGWGSRIPRTPLADRIARVVRERARREYGNWFCLGRTKKGEPRHPLMLPYATERVLWPTRGYERRG